MKTLLPLLAAALATFVLSFVWEAPASSGTDRRAAPSVARRAHCAEPARLRLRRFEDGSARLECAGRLLLAISVPG